MNENGKWQLDGDPNVASDRWIASLSEEDIERAMSDEFSYLDEE